MDKLKDVIYGLAIGDALGVPFEFMNRKLISTCPCKDMEGNGTYNQPKGSWSDDTSLTLCLLDGIDYKNHQINIRKVADNMILWMDEHKFTATGFRFDIGNTTRQSITKMKNRKDATKCGSVNDFHNGNGALMRISPLVFFLKDENDIYKRFEIVKNITTMTHGNTLNIVGCHIYIEFMLQILKNPNNNKFEILDNTINILNDFYKDNDWEYEYAYSKYERIFNKTIFKKNKGLFNNEFDESIIKSSGYIIDSLEASIFCFLTTKNYKESVLKAVNLGEDTDTIAAITGSMSGLYYGIKDIPIEWINSLLNKELINEILDKS